MLALALTILLFAFWTTVGCAVLWLLERELPALRMWLIAPAIGMAVNCLAVFLPNYFGVPVRFAAWPVLIVFGIGAIVLIFKLRPTVPVRRLIPFILPVLASLFIVGRPMMKFGFDWVSYCNDDMANYCLGAERVMNYAFFHQPSHQALVDGTNNPELLWFLHVPLMYRPGSEMLLAFVASITRLMPVEIYMRVMMAMHLVMISALGGLIAWKTNCWPAAVVACWMTALSALATLGTLYQLIAQVAGLGMLAACATLMLRPFGDGSWRGLFRQSVLIGIAGAGMLTIYPEITPFFGLPLIFYVVIQAARRAFETLRPILRLTGAAFLIAAAVLNTHIIPAISFIFVQVVGGSNRENLTIFPYYLMPSGMSNLWGFQSLATSNIPEPTQSLMIVAGLLLFIFVLAGSIWITLRGHPVGAISLSMLLLAFYLYFKGSGFGLFKLAMYLQPFMLGALVVTWFAIVRKWALRLAPLLLIVAGGYLVQLQYVRASEGVGKGFNEILDASAARIIDQTREVLTSGGPDGVYISDTHNITAAKFQMMSSVGHRAAFPSYRFMPPGANRIANYIGVNGTDINIANGQMLDTFLSQHPHVFFQLNGSDDPGPDVNVFEADLLAERIAQDPDAIIVLTTGLQSPLNRRLLGYTGEKSFLARPSSAVQNHLIFVASENGRPYFYNGGRPHEFSLYQLEKEPTFFTDRTMAGIGRYMLFQIINPTPKVRLVLDLTASYSADAENLLPPAVIVGKTREPFRWLPSDAKAGKNAPPRARGATRAISPPIEPQLIAGQYYVCLDLGTYGKPFKSVKTGLMRWYGEDVAVDRRELVAFLRDLSAITPAQYDAIEPPTSIQTFGVGGKHNDLMNPNLEYAGLYEDGWLGQAANLVLTQAPGGNGIIIRGEVPLIDDPAFTTEIIVLVDEKEVGRKVWPVGPFEMRADVSDVGGRRRVELRATNVQRLRHDFRPVACKLHYVGFQTPPWAPSRLEHFPNDISDPLFKATGLSVDGWISAKSSFAMTQLKEHGFLTLHGMVPHVADPVFTTEVTLRRNGKELAHKTVGLGDFEIRVPIEPAAGRAEIEVVFSKVQTLPAADGRTVGALLKLLAFESREIQDIEKPPQVALPAAAK